MTKAKAGEQIRDKGLQTRGDLNKKIMREYQSVFNSASEDDLTSFHSEAEIKCQLRDALCDTSMTDEMVQALYIKDDVLSDAYRYFTEESKDNQVYLAVWEYLDKAEHDYLANTVFDRARSDYEGYLEKVLKMQPSNIVAEAFKIFTLYDLHISLEPETSNFSTDQLRALHSLTNPLWSIYDEWMGRDLSYMDDIKDAILEVADFRAAENEAERYGIDPDPFGLDEQEGGQEP